MFAIGDERKEIIQGVWQRAFFSTLRFCSCIGQYYYSFLKFQLYPELKLCCSYLVNFSPGFSTNFSVSPFCFVKYTITARCPSSGTRFGTRWNSKGFLSLFFKPEWNFFNFFQSDPVGTSLNVIANISLRRLPLKARLTYQLG